MSERLRETSGSQRLLWGSVAMFVVITVVRLLVTTPGWGITLLYDVPVALVAVAFGLRAGLVSAAAGMILYALMDITRPVIVGGIAVHQNAAGYTSRAIVFVVLGGLLGVFADRLRTTERTLARVLDSTRDAIVSADASGTVIAFNRAAEETFGRSAAEVIGRPFAELVPDGGTGRRSDGSSFPAEIATSPFELGGETFTTAVITDITERRQIERERAAYQANLERSNTELEQFAYIASHDLQEPLRSISGFTALIEKRYQGQLDDDADRFIGFITDGVSRMQTMITGLLAYSRAGRDDLRPGRLDLGAVVGAAVTSLEAARAETGAEITVGELPTVSADADALGRVFQNLIGNALKFTNGSAPRIDVGAERADGGWTVSVRDNGIGIEPEHAERIFRMFQRLNPRGDYSGTGIGLAVSRTMVERQGGRIWCEAPASGPGTVFRVFLPDEPQLR